MENMDRLEEESVKRDVHTRLRGLLSNYFNKYPEVMNQINALPQKYGVQLFSQLRDEKYSKASEEKEALYGELYKDREEYIRLAEGVVEERNARVKEIKSEVKEMNGENPRSLLVDYDKNGLVFKKFNRGHDMGGLMAGSIGEEIKPRVGDYFKWGVFSSSVSGIYPSVSSAQNVIHKLEECLTIISVEGFGDLDENTFLVVTKEQASRIPEYPEGFPHNGYRDNRKAEVMNVHLEK